jgi:hypothetical protein
MSLIPIFSEFPIGATGFPTHLPHRDRHVVRVSMSLRSHSPKGKSWPQSPADRPAPGEFRTPAGAVPQGGECESRTTSPSTQGAPCLGWHPPGPVLIETPPSADPLLPPHCRASAAHPGLPSRCSPSGHSHIASPPVGLCPFPYPFSSAPNVKK